MSEKWTPGPWNLVWHNNEKYPFPLSILTEDRGHWVARDGACSSEANARLIAAAPELFDALEGMLRFDLRSDNARLDAVKIAKSALAKARGESAMSESPRLPIKGQIYVEWRKDKNEVALVYVFSDAYTCAVHYETILTALRGGGVRIEAEVQ